MKTGRIAPVVEDEDMSANVLRLFLEASSFTVRHCSNAEGALILAAKLSPALITLDLRLGGMNGWQCLQRLREDSILAHVPVVIVSGLPVSKPAPGLAAWHGAVGAPQR
jgi:DNA-binding response OmpR family regulator